MNRHTAISTAVAGLLALALGGCSPATAPAPSPSASEAPMLVRAAASPSPSPTADPHEQLLAQIPDAIRQEDLEGAIHLATLFVTLHPGLYQGENHDIFSYLSHYECDFCGDALWTTGMRVPFGELQQGGDVTVPDQTFDATLGTHPDGKSSASVAFDIIEEPHVTVNAGGEIVRSSDGGTYRIAMELVYSYGMWRVYEVAVE